MTAKKLLLFAVTTSLGLAVLLSPSTFADATGTVNKSQASGNFWFAIYNATNGNLEQESLNYSFTNQTLPYFLLSITNGQVKNLVRLRVSTTPQQGTFASYNYIVTDTIYSSKVGGDPNTIFNPNIGHTLTFNFTDGTSSTYDCSRYGSITLFNDSSNRPTLRATCEVRVAKQPSNFVHFMGYDISQDTENPPYKRQIIAYTSNATGALHLGTSSYTYHYYSSDDGSSTPSTGDSATADALEDIHKDEKDTINENGQDAQDSADGLSFSGFNVPNPFLNWFALFTDNACVSIPTIASWLHSNETNVCSPWANTPVRAIATPIFSVLGGMILFGFIVRWLKGTDFDGSIELDG